jgi:hypothetical protein
MTRFFFDLQNGGTVSTDETDWSARPLSKPKPRLRALTEMAKEAAPSSDNNFRRTCAGQSDPHH